MTMDRSVMMIGDVMMLMRQDEDSSSLPPIILSLLQLNDQHRKLMLSFSFSQYKTEI